ncbi:hypothetical protein BGZ46_004912, partial [Entomortierella lignicola]
HDRQSHKQTRPFSVVENVGHPMHEPSYSAGGGYISGGGMVTNDKSRVQSSKQPNLSRNIMSYSDSYVHGQGSPHTAPQSGMNSMEGIPLLSPSHLPYPDPHGQSFQPMVLNSGPGNRTISTSLDSVPVNLGPPAIMSHSEFGVASYMTAPPNLLPKRTQTAPVRSLHYRANSAGGESVMSRHHRTRTSSVNSVSSIASNGMISSITTSMGSTNISFSGSPTSINTAIGDTESMISSPYGVSTGRDIYDSMPYSPTSHKSRLSGQSRKAVAARAFLCSVPGCNKAYTQLHNLKSHERTGHTPVQKPKPFLCIISGCGKAFSQRKSLALHIRASHKEYKFKPFKCSQPSCQKSYTQLHNLRTHEKTVHMLDLSRKRIRNPTPNTGNIGTPMNGIVGNNNSDEHRHLKSGQASSIADNQVRERNQLDSGTDNSVSYDMSMDGEEDEEDGEEAEEEEDEEDEYVDE